MVSKIEEVSNLERVVEKLWVQLLQVHLDVESYLLISLLMTLRKQLSRKHEYS